MRVIAGEAKGRSLAAPHGGATLRPTAERVREALFSMIGQHVVGARVLDLYAGTGALGIEALSRGASAAVFVDRDPAAVDCIGANLRATGLEARAQVMKASAAAFCAQQATSFDLVLMDPPYGDPAPVDVIQAMAANGLVGAGGEVVVEVASGAALDPAGWDILARRRYGDSALVFLRPASAAAGAEA